MRNVIFFIFFSTIMITGLGFGFEDTGLGLGLEHAVLEPIPGVSVYDIMIVSAVYLNQHIGTAMYRHVQ